MSGTPMVRRWSSLVGLGSWEKALCASVELGPHVVSDWLRDAGPDSAASAVDVVVGQVADAAAEGGT